MDENCGTQKKPMFVWSDGMDKWREEQFNNLLKNSVNLRAGGYKRKSRGKLKKL